jgi:AmmeMemoRadiSam system protein B
MNGMRPARLAGKWYPAERKGIFRYLPKRDEVPGAVAALCPHAGWQYSGRVAGEVYARLPPADVFVLVGVDHRGSGPAVNVWPGGDWATPLGALPTDDGFAGRVRTVSKHAGGDADAHALEHSLEVQAPFVAARFPKASLVPILTFDAAPAACRELGLALASGVRADGRRVTLVASSDLSHVGEDYGAPPPPGVTADAHARAQDLLALDRILALDADGLLETVRTRRITMCGYAATAAVIHAAKALGARRAEQVAYATSTETSRDHSLAVGYAGILFLL